MREICTSGLKRGSSGAGASRPLLSTLPVKILNGSLSLIARRRRFRARNPAATSVPSRADIECDLPPVMPECAFANPDAAAGAVDIVGVRLEGEEVSHGRAKTRRWKGMNVNRNPGMETTNDTNLHELIEQNTD